MDARTIGKAINVWTNTRPYADQLLALLNQGYSIEIKRSDFDNWSSLNPNYLHAYPAVFDGNILKFVLTDSVTDAQQNIDYTFVTVKDYTYGSMSSVNVDFDTPGNGNISIVNGLERVFRWLMNKTMAVGNMVKTTDGIFQGFRIPFNDLKELFGSTSGDSVYVLLGLEEDGTADMILWNEIMNFVDPAMVEDTVTPIPPFSATNPESNYQLLVQSTNY